ncbi:Na+/H+ antiporter [Siccirubricoccus deserti]|uniref:Na+/H+ antiporter n=1 Tax=Siccirubricoccus deserti TaxID=2013562 RepID=A0A9X0UG90_9PROT|nr:Na+/H+ antiporter [Siccirubricoccus deserti]MBC4015130.1 Na+/H+ antiporter [Siccirubricoccus deserti]GGC38735.1 Na+/H+ antiporter [Siccirubricoccus deserti]
MAFTEIVLLLIAACIGFAVLARRLGVPYAVILVLGGMALALVPDVPVVRLDPEFALAFFLPPLLQASAVRTDWRAFRSNLRPILLLAVGAVIFTAFCIGAVARWLVPEMPWAAALTLGAIVAPPDAVAAAAVLQRLRLPRRIVSVLEGESLINDASALVLYKLAVGAAMAGGTLAAGGGVLTFLALAAGGVAIGWAVAQVTLFVLHRLNDVMLETTTGFLAAYAAYLAGEAAGVSGVLAVVTAGLLFGPAQHTLMSPQARLAGTAVWGFVEFILNSLVFVLIGLQLNQVLARIGDRGAAELAWLAGVISATLILSRFLWVFPASWLPRITATKDGALPPTGREATIVAWAGMRGVVSLATALALPMDFPQRDLIVFLAFCAILATLVLQGTTLEWLIKTLKVALPHHDGGIDPTEAEARRAMAQAALAEVERRLDDPLEGAIAADMVAEFRDRAGHLHRTAANRGAAAAERAARRRIRLAALEAARRSLLFHHATGALDSEGLARLERALDLEEQRIRQVLGDERTAAQKAADAMRRRSLLQVSGHA